MLSPLARQQKARIAALTRHHGGDDPTVIKLATEFKAERLAEHMRTVAFSEPQLSEEQRARIAAQLVSVLGAPDELTCRRLLAILNGPKVGDPDAA